MKKLFQAALAAVFLLAFAAAGALLSPAHSQQLTCNQNVKYDASTSGSTRLFTANATSPNQVYICGYLINVGPAINVGFTYGTGTNCGTGTTALTPVYVLPIAGQIFDDAGIWHGLTVPAGKDLCISTSAGTAVQAIVYYAYQ
jgi:hypothetical protein